MRVLVVDDEPIVRDVLSRYLARDGYEVRSEDAPVRRPHHPRTGPRGAHRRTRRPDHAQGVRRPAPDGVEPGSGLHSAGAVGGALGFRVRRGPLHRDGPRATSSREDRARSLDAEAPRHGVGCRLSLRPMSWHRAPMWIAGLVVLGAAGTIGLAWAAGMGGRDLVHLAVLLAPAGIATILISWAAARLLMHASLRRRPPAAAIIGVVVALLNLGVLAASMAVDRHDVVLVGLL